MPLRISTNVASIAAQGSLDQSQRAMEKSFAQLSSGSRITKASDDAAGLTISENLKSRIRGYRQAQRNAQDAVSVMQVAEGGLNEISNILVRMRELGVQAASDNIGDRERSFIDKEVQQLKAEVDRISNTTKFGDVELLNGTGETFEFQVDLGNDDTNDRISFDASDIEATASTLGVDSFDFSEKENARDAL
jgi:flagellin